MTTVNEDVDALASDPQLLHLPGAERDVLINPLYTRELFKLLKVLTVGAGPLLTDLRIDADTDPEEMTQQLLALLLVSIPEAEDEVIEFMRAMVRPVGLVDPERTKADREINTQMYHDLYVIIQNPRPEDSIAILSKIIETETPNMVALGKQIAALLPSVAKLTNSSKKPTTKRTRSAS